MSIKVMLADDHVLMREGIRQLLEFDGSIEVIAEANDGEECIEKLKTVHPQILLLDINMPKKNGIEVLQEIKNKNINVKVLILTVHGEIEYLLKAVDIGVDGYILKDSESSELKKAINAVINGESYIQPKLIPALNNRLVARDVDKDKIDHNLIEIMALNNDVSKNGNEYIGDPTEIALYHVCENHLVDIVE